MGENICQNCMVQSSQGKQLKGKAAYKGITRLLIESCCEIILIIQQRVY